ncbi:DUF3152 domain-containing protein [Streptomyces sp. NBC_01465]|uniref:DUF3152 domain-containing protein n=1 Tax=Streptomyces sp. NBC_01465 TaxID=2903878 RepID=UPI002E3141AD|nr:DUF3152 domain-containing protein [Streptomyces sp. NBC_01465]
MGQRGAVRRDRRPFVRSLLIGCLLSVLALAGGAAFAAWDGRSSDAVGIADHVVLTPPSPSDTPTPAASKAKAKSKPTPRTTPKKTTVPASGPGTFTTAQSHGSPVGSGPLRRYRVQVEDGSGVSASEAAAEIQTILANPRGWAAHGRGTFQLVATGGDFIIRIATPATADRLCLESLGLHTHGELNCETADGVVVNLRRWQLGSPQFNGSAAEYRHLIINHEVGHQIGIHMHMACPGPGKLAPVMQQQIKGLDGCRSNAFPYATDGTYITGPTVP